MSSLFFHENIFFCYIFVTDRISLPDCLHFFEISGNMFIVIVCYSVCDVMNFEIYPSFFMKPFKNENSFQGETKDIVSSFLIHF